MMLTLHRISLAAGVAVTVLVTACATGPTELTVDPATAPTGTVEPAAQPVGPADEPTADAASTTAPKRVSTTREDPPGRAPAPGTSRAPAPPESSGTVVDGDGCAVDVATGLVITCADPAAGPDEATAEFCAIDPAHVSCTER
jgi:hypothetical protein